MYRSARASGLLTFRSTLTNWQIIFKPLDGIFWKKKKKWESCPWNVVLGEVWVSILLVYCSAVKWGLRFANFFMGSFLFTSESLLLFKVLSASLIFTWTAVTNNAFEICKNANFCCARKYETWRQYPE